MHSNFLHVNYVGKNQSTRANHPPTPGISPKIDYFSLAYFIAGRGGLREIIKIAVTRCHILKLKCIKFDFGWGYAPHPTGELTAFHSPLAGFKGPTSKEREGKKWRDMGRRKRAKIIGIACQLGPYFRLKSCSWG